MVESGDGMKEAAIGGEHIERESTRFLYHEAELLDRREFSSWLELMSPEVDYRVPVRTTREAKDGPGFSTKAFFLEEDYASLKMRIARLASDFAWSENPPSRTRRQVTNIRPSLATEGSNEGPALHIISNLVVYCFRGHSPSPAIITAERQDVIRREKGAWKLRRRLVLLDTTILDIESLSIFL